MDLKQVAACNHPKEVSLYLRAYEPYSMRASVSSFRGVKCRAAYPRVYIRRQMSGLYIHGAEALSMLLILPLRLHVVS